MNWLLFLLLRNHVIKEYFKIHIIEYCANQGIVFPKKSSYCKDCAIQGFVNQGIAVLVIATSIFSGPY